MTTPKKIKTRVIKVRADTLRIHPNAQRDLVPSQLKKLYDDFDLDAIGVLHAVEYEIDGELAIWIIDGQHRVATLIKHGLGEWEVEVKIHMDVKDDARAAQLFLELNNRASVSPFDKFKNSCTARKIDALRVYKIAEEHKLKIGKTSGDGSICCVSALQKIFKLDDGKALILTLETLTTAFGHTASAVEGKLVEGVGLLYKTYNGTIDRPALVKKLSKYPGGASGLLGDGKGIRQYRHCSVSRGVAERVLEVYNQGRKVKLDPL